MTKAQSEGKGGEGNGREGKGREGKGREKVGPFTSVLYNHITSLSREF